MIAYLSTAPHEPGSCGESEGFGDTEDTPPPTFERALGIAAGNGPINCAPLGPKRKWGLFGNLTVATVKFGPIQPNPPIHGSADTVTYVPLFLKASLLILCRRILYK